MKLELRAITVRPAIFDRSVMMSSLMPSEKYSCSGSPDMLVNGKTAIDAVATLGNGFSRLDLAEVRRRAGMPFPDSDRPVDILDANVAGVLEADVDPVADAFVDDRGNADAAGLGQRLQPRGNVDAVAVDVVALNDHIAEIDADPQYDLRLVQGLIR